MRRIISLALVLMMLAGALLCFASCSEEDITKELKFELLEDDTYAVVGFTGDETEIVIPDTYEGKPVTVIGSDAFRENDKLVKVTLPTSLRTVKNNAFYHCVSLETVVFNEGTERIDMSAFYGCTALKEVALPSTVTEICNFAFQACTAIEKINIPAGVQKKYLETFKGCVGMKVVVIDNAMFAAELDGKVDCGYVASYAETVYIKDGITDIGKYITDNFKTAESDMAGYVKYIKK